MTDPTVATPSAAYAAGIARDDWSFDPAQQPALVELDRLHATLLDPPGAGCSTTCSASRWRRRAGCICGAGSAVARRS